MTKIDIDQIKADGPISEWFTKSEAGTLWDSFSDPRLSYGREVFCRRIERLPDLEDALIEAVDILSGVDCGPEYAAVIRNFLERFK